MKLSTELHFEVCLLDHETKSLRYEIQIRNSLLCSGLLVYKLKGKANFLLKVFKRLLP